MKLTDEGKAQDIFKKRQEVIEIILAKGLSGLLKKADEVAP